MAFNLHFDWNKRKAVNNLKKHGVSFEEAKTVFDDLNALTYHDVEHSEEEDRYWELGLSQNSQLLNVWYTMRQTTIRIIGARLANKREASEYYEKINKK